MPSLPLASASRSSAGGVFWWCGKTMRSIYAAVLLLYCLSVAAFAPTTMHRCPVHYQTHIIISANNVENDDPTGYSNVDQKNQLSEQSSLIRERIKNGNYLDVLQVSVILFFLLTLWISGGNILSDYSSSTSNDPNGAGKSRVYKYIDADKLLRDEFDREDSKVIFE
mmetsp:Transcript_20592/g.41085  ORF Transcript_20592/g.41085 Transcript_20592/m.41085 type:complete len:167 (-) Transcript_20592:1390-1890(-)